MWIMEIELEEDKIAENIQKAIDIVIECLNINKIPNYIGVTALNRIIIDTFKRQRCLKEYKQFLEMNLKFSDDYWQEE